MKEFAKKIIISALEAEAKLVLKKYKPKIVAVTGNVGKTSTKDAIYTVMAASFFTRKSEKSFNGDIGVPLTILGLQNAWTNPLLWIENICKGLLLILFSYPYPEWLVLEVGADRPGDIEKIMQWVKPDVSVVTRIGAVPVHVEFFKNREELVKEKSFLARGLKPGGLLILNADDADVASFKSLTKAQTLFVSTQTSAGNANTPSFVASHLSVWYEKKITEKGEEEVPTGITFRIDHAGSSVPVVRKGVLGGHHVYPALFAYAVGVSQGINPVKITEALEAATSTAGRMRLLRAVKDAYVIDDTYNAAPMAMSEALNALAEVKVKGRKIAVLGDMMELGKQSTGVHQQIGMQAGKIADLLVAVGIRARHIADGALSIGLDESKIFQFDDSREAGKFVEEKLAAGDIVLVKGSQSMRMERAVKEIMADPDLAEELLVRQDEEWMKR